MGSGGGCRCGGPRGFCGSCFDRGFNEDPWDKEDQRAAAPPSTTTEQPRNVEAMTSNAPQTLEEGPHPSESGSPGNAMEDKVENDTSGEVVNSVTQEPVQEQSR